MHDNYLISIVLTVPNILKKYIFYFIAGYNNCSNFKQTKINKVTYSEIFSHCQYRE